MKSDFTLSDAVMAPFSDGTVRPRRAKAAVAAGQGSHWETTVTPALLPAVAAMRAASANNTQRDVDALPSGSTTTETLPDLRLLDLPQVEEAGDLAPLRTIISSDGTKPVASKQAATSMDPETKAALLAKINAAPKPFDKAAMLARLNARQGIVVIDPVTEAESGAFGSAADLATRSTAEVAADRRKADDMLRVALQGMSLGSADEIEAAGRAAFGGSYEDSLANARNSVDRARQIPGAGVLEFAASVAAPGFGAARFIAAPGVAAQAARGVVAGAGLGGAQGFVSAEDGVANRAKAGAVGAAFGGVVGGAAPLVAAGGRTIDAGLSARLGIGDERAAQQMIVDALRKEADATGGNYADAVAGVATRTRDGARPLALAGNQPLNDLARAVAGRSETARRGLSDLVVDTERNAGPRLTTAIDDALIEPLGVHIDRASRNRAMIGRDAYDELYSRNTTHDLSRAADPTRPGIADAIANANRVLADEGLPVITNTSAMTPRQIDYALRALGESADGAFKSGAVQRGHALAKLRDDFERAAYDAVPHYQAYRGLYSQASGEESALAFGRGFPMRDGAKMDDALQEFARMPDAERRLARLGIVQGVRDGAANSANPADFILHTASRPATRAALDSVVGLANNPRPSFDAIRAHEAVTELHNQAGNVAGARQLARGLPASDSAFSELANADALGLLLAPKATLARRVYSKTVDPLNDRRARLVAELLARGDGRALDVLRNADPATRRAALVEALSIGGSNQFASGVAGVVSDDR